MLNAGEFWDLLANRPYLAAHLGLKFNPNTRWAELKAEDKRRIEDHFNWWQGI